LDECVVETGGCWRIGSVEDGSPLIAVR
jgi:hypothetical protein